jgi:hypothetical protein
VITPDPRQPTYIKVAGVGSMVAAAVTGGMVLGPAGAAIAGVGALLTGMVMWFAKPPKVPRRRKREMRDEGDDAV